MNQGDDRLVYGFDTHAMRVVDPNLTFEMMSYCGGLDPVGTYRWISDFTWDGFRSAFAGRFSTATPGISSPLAVVNPSVAVPNTFLFVGGTIDLSNDALTFNPFAQITTQQSPAPALTGEYTLEMRDAADNLVGAPVPFDLQLFEADPEPVVQVKTQAKKSGADSESGDPVAEEEVTIGLFDVTVPFDTDMRTAVIIRGGVEIGRMVGSANAPTVALTSPTGGETFEDDLVTVSWSGQDADGDALSYNLLYSADGGATYTSVLVDSSATSVSIERTDLANSDNALFRVMASDGFNVAIDDSAASFSVANNVPLVDIAGPVSGDFFTGVQGVALTGSALDTEDGLLEDSQLQWSSNIDGALGSGEVLDVTAADLTEGEHTISLTATDNDGGIGTATVDISIARIFGDAQIFAAMLPLSRSTQVGVPVSAFATLINTSPTSALSCRIVPPAGLPIEFQYQTTDSATNAVTRSVNTPVGISPLGVQSFVVVLTPTATIAPTELELGFECTNADAAGIIRGVNTFQFSASNSPVPDVIALAATESNDGTVQMAEDTGAGAFAVASVNVGIAADIVVTADTGDVFLPVTLAICETDPTTGVCINPTQPTFDPVTTSIASNGTPTFSIFANGSGDVPFDPATNRVFVRFAETNGTDRGATSVAISTAPPPPVCGIPPVIGGADDHGGDAATATAIDPNGSLVAGNLETGGDVDLFAFAALAGETYVIETSNLGSGSDTFLNLIGGDGSTSLAQNDDGGAGLASLIVHTATVDGCLFPRVRHFSQTTGTGTYELSVTTN